jgi:hypothetical protein
VRGRAIGDRNSRDDKEIKGKEHKAVEKKEEPQQDAMMSNDTRHRVKRR